MDVIMVVVLILAAIGFVLWLTIRSDKRKFFEESVHIVGLLRKNYLILRDERLVPALWRIQVLSVCIIFSAVSGAVLIGLAMHRGQLLVPVIILSVIVTAFFVVIWLKSRKDFDKMKDELGIVLERDEVMVKALLDKNKKKTFHIIWIIAGSLNFIRHFMAQEILFSIVWGAVAIIHLLDILFYFIKKKRGKQEQD